MTQERIEELFQELLARKHVEIAYVRDDKNFYRLTPKGIRHAEEVEKNLVSPR